MLILILYWCDRDKKWEFYHARFLCDHVNVIISIVTKVIIKIPAFPINSFVIHTYFVYCLILLSNFSLLWPWIFSIRKICLDNLYNTIWKLFKFTKKNNLIVIINVYDKYFFFDIKSKYLEIYWIKNFIIDRKVSAFSYLTYENIDKISIPKIKFKMWVVIYIICCQLN